MVDLELEGIVGIGRAVFDALNDLGLAIGAGRALRWRVVVGVWVLAVACGIPLWSGYPRFFDSSPGSAVLVAGLWIMLALVTLAVTIARARSPVSGRRS